MRILILMTGNNEIEKDISKEFEHNIRKMYSIVEDEDRDRAIYAFQKILTHAQERGKTTQLILDEVARMIFSLFKFKEILIGLKNKDDGSLRYVTIFGYTPEVEKVLRKSTFTYDAFMGNEKSKGIPLSKFSRYSMVEYLIPEEWQEYYEQTSNEIISLRKPRTSLEELHEGDDINVFMFGPNEELIGWFELGLTIDKKLPQKSTIRMIELLASVMGNIIYEREWK